MSRKVPSVIGGVYHVVKKIGGGSFGFCFS
jgi:hypothetical protein